jgi:NADPH2:quinone reductase
MKAVTFAKPLPIDDPDSLHDSVVEAPVAGPRDLLVEVRAISVNPVDTKVRSGGGPGTPAGKVLGWDAAGVVKAVGGAVTLFRPGDEVYYAGALERAGSYAELQAVDERLVAKKPRHASFAEAAALPLTAITAWELAFDRMHIPVGDGPRGAVLVLGAAGGVGSIAVQLLRQRTPHTVIGTASRPETQAWVGEMGAHHVIDHRRPLAAQVKALVPGGVDWVLGLTKVEEHFDELVEAFAPQGALGLIETPATPLDIAKLKPKSLALCWELMFTRSRFQTADMGEQGRLLGEVARLVDAGAVRSTMRTQLGRIDAANLRRAHALLESGRTIGKIVLEGF